MTADRLSSERLRQRDGFGLIGADNSGDFKDLPGRTVWQCESDLCLRAGDGVGDDDAVRTFAVALALHEHDAGGIIAARDEDIRRETTRGHHEKVFFAADGQGALEAGQPNEFARAVKRR